MRIRLTVDGRRGEANFYPVAMQPGEFVATGFGLQMATEQQVRAAPLEVAQLQQAEEEFRHAAGFGDTRNNKA